MASISTAVYAVWRVLEGGDISQTSKYTYKQIREFVVAAVLEGLKANYYEQLNTSEYRYGSSDITTTTEQDVKTDGSTGLQYVNIPLQAIKVAGNRSVNISSSNPISGMATRYVPVRAEEVFVMKLQPPVPCMIPYYLENGKAYFFQDKVYDKKVKVSQKYALPTDDNADLTLPESEGMVIERALRLLSAQFPSDGSNDGVDKNRVIS